MKRIAFIDLFRGWAALVMIEVHVFNSLIIPDLKTTDWYEVLNFVNGLVAPAFLFLAGMVFVVAGDRKLDEFRTFGPAFRKQIARIASIWAIGYLLHLPVFSLTGVLEAGEGAWVSFFQSDILHCIAFGLAVLFGLRIAIRNDRIYTVVIAALAVGAVFLAPMIGSWDAVRSLHPSVRSYLDHRLSLFPLTPWLGFILGGGLAGMLYLRTGGEPSTNRFTNIALIGGALMVVAGIPSLFQVTLFPDGFERANDPLFFFLRFGLIVLLLLVCQRWVLWRGTESSFVLDAGRESLLVYVGHLQVLYGRFFDGQSVVDRVRGTFTPLECLGATVLLIAVMIAAAIGWNRLKYRSQTATRAVLIGGGALIAAYFVIQ